MKLVLTLRAEADIDAIAAYIWARNPQGAQRVEADIQAAFRLISAYPSVGREVAEGVRRFALPRYPYLIFYGIEPGAAEISVFTFDIPHVARKTFDGMTLRQKCGQQTRFSHRPVTTLDRRGPTFASASGPSQTRLQNRPHGDFS